MLSHPQHAQFLIRKLWAEFIASPIPQATLDALIAAYKARASYQLRPVIRGILMHPLIFESLNEPNLIKPPIVYMVGVLRAARRAAERQPPARRADRHAAAPYRPPNVAGWEGGMSWLNTNTVQGRFDMIVTRPVPEVLELLPRTGPRCRRRRQLPAGRQPGDGAGGLRARVRGPSTARGSPTRRETALIAWAGTTPRRPTTTPRSAGSASTRCRP